MRIIEAHEIKNSVKELILNAAYILPKDVEKALNEQYEREKNSMASDVLDVLVKNAKVAKEQHIPLCQDTGMTVVFAQIGQEVCINGGLFSDAVNAGVREAYDEGFLRKSVVSDPLLCRENTGDNTPAIIHTELTAGDKIKLFVMLKGFGSENMSRIKMFNPTATQEDIINFAVNAVKEAGGNPCPPIIVGMGIGGDFEYAAYLSKKALLRDIGDYHRVYGDFEKKLLSAINETKVGVGGLGVGTTALWAAVECYPTHIAGLPVALNICCHSSRHGSVVI